MKPKNHPFWKDNDLPNLYFWVLCQFSQVYPFPAIFFGKCRDQPWWCQSLTSEMARCRGSWDHWQGSSDWKSFVDRIESRHGSCPCHTLNKDVEWYWKNVGFERWVCCEWWFSSTDKIRPYRNGGCPKKVRRRWNFHCHVSFLGYNIDDMAVWSFEQ